MKKIVTIILVTTALMLTTNVVRSAFWNLSGNVVAHDPCIIKEGNTWWSFQTGSGIGVKYSSDGLNWNQGIQMFATELSWWRNYAPNMGENDVWAPDCFYHNGRYWLYYSVSQFGTRNSAIGLSSCSSISKGDWRDDGMVISSNSSNTYNAIDPNITKDASGALWLSFGSWSDGIKVVKLNTATMKPTGSIYSIAKRSGGIEAADIVYNNGYYYLFVSINKCCLGVNSTYKTVYGRATQITGPYYDKNGVSMLNGGYSVLDEGNALWVGPGGQDIYKNGNNVIIIRHAYDATDNGTPKMLINDLYFSGDWPVYDISYVQLKNRGTGLYVDGMGRTSDGSNCGQYSYSSSYNQQWELEDHGNYVKLKNRRTGLYLDGMGSTTNGSSIGLWNNSVNYNQQWLKETTGSYIKLKNRTTGLYLDGMGRTANGADMGQWSNSSSYNQQFALTSLKSATIATEATQEETLQNLVIYPNPVLNGLVNINIPNSKGHTTIRIRDLCGRVVIENQTEDQLSIPLQLNVLPGIYIVEVTYGDKMLTDKVLVK